MWTSTLPSKDELKLPKRREVSTNQKEMLKQHLEKLKKALVMRSVHGDHKGRTATILSCPSYFLQFTDLQIKQVLDHSELISSVDDVMACVEVWSYKHAEAIYTIFVDIFIVCSGFLRTSLQFRYVDIFCGVC